MNNIENSLSNLQDASTNGVGHYCFYIEDPIPFNPSYFYWYPTLDSLFDSLRDDLYAIFFHNDGNELINQFYEEIEQVITEFRLKKTPVFFELTKRINDICEEYENHSNMRFCYIGTYDALCEGSDTFERSVRNRFRNGSSYEGAKRAGPIKDTEREDFNDFLSNNQ
jgi:hypothetical protein